MRVPVLAAVGVLALAAGPLCAPLCAEEPSYDAVLQAKAPSVVAVKFVLKANLSFGGQSQDQEQSREVRGALVDASGLVMLANSHLEFGGGRLRGMRGAQVKSSANDFKVLFGNEATEHDAVLVARDSTLGLAFVQLTDVASVEKPPPPVAIGKPVEPKIGQFLVGVSRKSRGFDCAPMVERVFVNGVVDKPRRMWSVSGAQDSAMGLPVYDASGAVVGVLSMQSGSEGVGAGDGGGLAALLGGGGESGAFVLPVDAVARSLDAAKKRAPEALAKAKEAAAEAAAMSEAPPPAMGDEPPMGEGMGSGSEPPPEHPK
jgi:hypothetical protein